MEDCQLLQGAPPAISMSDKMQQDDLSLKCQLKNSLLSCSLTTVLAMAMPHWTCLLLQLAFSLCWGCCYIWVCCKLLNVSEKIWNERTGERTGACGFTSRIKWLALPFPFLQKWLVSDSVSLGQRLGGIRLEHTEELCYNQEDFETEGWAAVGRPCTEVVMFLVLPYVQR